MTMVRCTGVCSFSSPNFSTAFAYICGVGMMNWRSTSGSPKEWWDQISELTAGNAQCRQELGIQFCKHKGVCAKSSTPSDSFDKMALKVALHTLKDVQHPGIWTWTFYCGALFELLVRSWVVHGHIICQFQNRT
jgi:hypothetical protein